MKKSKRKWVQPKLIVLVKCKLEEGVLATCKWVPITGPGTIAGACSVTMLPCLGCSAMVRS